MESNYLKESLDNFVEHPQKPLSECKAVLLPVSFEATASYMKGTKAGPKAIIDASKHLEWFDLELGKEIVKEVPIFTSETLKPKNVKGLLESVESSVKEIVSQKKFPLLFGGEHSITFPAVKACASSFDNLSVLSIDAHADLRNELNGEKYSHACVMRRCSETSKIVLAGVRSLSAEEKKFAEKSGVKIFFGNDFSVKEVVDSCSKNVYLSIDLDAFDPSIMPAVGTPEPCGLDWGTVLGLCRELFKRKTVVGADLVELSPIKGLRAPDFAAAKLAYKILGYRFLPKASERF